MEAGIITSNPAHGVRKSNDNVRDHLVTEDEYRVLGGILHDAIAGGQFEMAAEATRQIARTGCRRMEIIALRWAEMHICGSRRRLLASKEGKSARPVSRPVVEYMEGRRA